MLHFSFVPLRALSHVFLTVVRTDITVLRDGVHVIVGTPGRVLDLLSRRAFNPASIKIFVLDEADEMLSRGFKDQIYDVFQGTCLRVRSPLASAFCLYFGRRVLTSLWAALPSNVQVGLFSATMPPEALEITEKFMNKPVRILVKQDEVTLEGIRQFYINCEREQWKLDTLCDLYDTLNIAQVCPLHLLFVCVPLAPCHAALVCDAETPTAFLLRVSMKLTMEDSSLRPPSSAPFTRVLRISHRPHVALGGDLCEHA